MKLKLNGNGKNGNGNGKNGNGHSQTPLKIALLALAVVLVGLLLFRQVQRFLGPTSELWVASGNLAPGSLIGEEDLKLAELRQRHLPEGVIADRRLLEGQQIVRPVEEGEPFVRGDVAPPRRRVDERQAAGLAELLPEGRVLAPIRLPIETVFMSELRFGDRFEIVAALPARGREAGGAHVVASDVFFVAWIDPALAAANDRAPEPPQQESGDGLLADLLAMPPGTPGSGGGGGGIPTSTKLLLALHPSDVLPLTEAEAAGASLSMVLHGKKEVEQGELLELPDGRSTSVDLITGGRREQVPVS